MAFHYSDPVQFEPLLPTNRLDELVETTRSVFERSSALKASASPEARSALRDIVRSMNSYYSNRIEGQATHPMRIAEALNHDFSDTPDIARRQRLALAHMAAEAELEPLVTTEASALTSAFLRLAHQKLYERLHDSDRELDDGTVLMPGELRTREVQVGRHLAPAWQSVPRFLARMDQRYGDVGGVDKVLFTIASAHHRMAWTHPFADGNGRAVRLQTHCALLPFSAGLWSVNRGLARNRDQYYAMLAGADAPRQGDLDGRGNLSERQLWAWCKWFVELCEDQVNFMSAMMDLHTLRDRVAAYVVVKGRAEGIKEYREECILALQTVATSGAVSRGDFVRMTGLGERTGRASLSRFLKDGLLRPAGDASHRSEVGIGFPISSLNVLFPNLYPEAATAVMD